MKKIYIVRHCRAEGQAADARLTTEGIEQADRLAGFLSDRAIDYILSSPYERACRSIQPLADKQGLQIVVDDRLTERVLSGTNRPEWRDMLFQSFRDLDLCYEGGESGRSAMSRAVRVVKEALNSRYENIVIVSHGNLISLLLKYFDGRIGFAEWEALSNPDIYLLSFVNETPTIQRIWKE